MILRFLSFLIMVFFFWSTTSAQDEPNRSDIFTEANDSLQVEIDSAKLSTEPQKIDDPLKATLLSAVLPGLGQAYNESYWKIPIIYGGLFIFATVIDQFNFEYVKFRNALIAVNDNDPQTTNPYEGIITPTNLERRVDFYRRNRDFTMILTAAFYLLNVVEANVDAHLKTFDISDELTFKIEPSIDYLAFNYHVGIKFKFLVK